MSWRHSEFAQRALDFEGVIDKLFIVGEDGE